jgi:hypothetical protein
LPPQPFHIHILSICYFLNSVLTVFETDSWHRMRILRLFPAGLWCIWVYDFSRREKSTFPRVQLHIWLQWAWICDISRKNEFTKLNKLLHLHAFAFNCLTKFLLLPFLLYFPNQIFLLNRPVFRLNDSSNGFCLSSCGFHIIFHSDVYRGFVSLACWQSFYFEFLIVHVRWWGTMSQCSMVNLKDSVTRRETVVSRLHMDCASLRINASRVWSKAWRVAFYVPINLKHFTLNSTVSLRYIPWNLRCLKVLEQILYSNYEVIILFWHRYIIGQNGDFGLHTGILGFP